MPGRRPLSAGLRARSFGGLEPVDDPGLCPARPAADQLFGTVLRVALVAEEHPVAIDRIKFDQAGAPTGLLGRDQSRGPIRRSCRGRFRHAPTHTRKAGRRFAYYISNRLIAGGKDPSGWRLPAEALETCLNQVVAQHLRRATVAQRLLAAPDASGAAELNRRSLALADLLERDPALLGKTLVAGSLTPGRLTLQLDPAKIATALGVPEAALAPDLLFISEPFALRRRSVETRIIAGETMPAPDEVLQRTLSEAHRWARALRQGTSLTEIARDTGRSEPYIRTRISLAFLAPKPQARILDGRQPVDLSVLQLIRDGIPMDWAEQAKIFQIA